MVWRSPEGPTEFMREKGSLKREAEARALKDFRNPMCVCQDGGIVFASERFENMLGYAPGELEKTPLAPLLSQARLTAQDSPDIVCEEDEFPVRQTFVRKDGALVDTFLRVEGCVYKGRPAILLVARDSGSGESFPIPGEEKPLIPAPVFAHLQMTVSTDGRILAADESCSKILGRPVFELVGAKLEEFVSQDDAGLLDALLRAGRADSEKGSLSSWSGRQTSSRRVVGRSSCTTRPCQNWNYAHTTISSLDRKS